MEQIFNRILEETHISLRQIRAVVQLLDDKNTVPFIARYRKEATGGLDENQIRLIEERLNFHRNLEQRKEEVIRLIEEQGKLTAECCKRPRPSIKRNHCDMGWKCSTSQKPATEINTISQAFLLRKTLPFAALKIMPI